MRLRPGAAAVAARAGAAGAPVAAGAIAVEYAFWADRKPEVFVRARRVEPGGPSTADWQRALTGAMRENASALASLVIARDPAPFDDLLGSGGRIHPVYDALLRLTGRSGSIDASRRGAPEARA